MSLHASLEPDRSGPRQATSRYKANPEGGDGLLPGQPTEVLDARAASSWRPAQREPSGCYAAGVWTRTGLARRPQECFMCLPRGTSTALVPRDFHGGGVGRLGVPRHQRCAQEFCAAGHREMAPVRPRFQIESDRDLLPVVPDPSCDIAKPPPGLPVRDFTSPRESASCDLRYCVHRATHTRWAIVSPRCFEHRCPPRCHASEIREQVEDHIARTLDRDLLRSLNHRRPPVRRLVARMPSRPHYLRRPLRILLDASMVVKQAGVADFGRASCGLLGRCSA